MRYLALCTDYDGTLATDGRVLPDTLSALERLLASGRRLVLVTGRELDDLREVCPRLDLFQYVVAENGALLYHPETGKETPLAPRPPEAFVTALRERGVGPISVGRVIVATWEPHETTVLETIRDLGLELQVIFNKGAVMILPAGVNKATGLVSALEKMGLSPHNAVGIGDAENDHALLGLCECSAAVANALPTLKSAADIVTVGDHGAGVVELIDELLQDDLVSCAPKLHRHHILLGMDEHGSKVFVPPHGETLLLAGAPNSGKSELAEGLMRRLGEQGYTFCLCLIDVEGKHGAIPQATSLGTSSRPPTVMEIVKLLQGPDQSVVINLAGLSVTDRVPFFKELSANLVELAARVGRPHWVTLDEAHALLPAETGSRESNRGPRAGYSGTDCSFLHITERPSLIAREVLRSVSLFIATGASAPALLQEFGQSSGLRAPSARLALNDAQALAWRPGVPDSQPTRINIATAQRDSSVADATSAAIAAAANARVAKTRGVSE
jgi:hydroxymethylpyrimidine pyrophosphatase-like HAD family hydrolase